MKTLPKYWAVKTDKAHPLWNRFKKWLIIEMKKEENYDNGDEDDIDDWGYNGYSDSGIDAWNGGHGGATLITLEEWDSLVNGTQNKNLTYETQYLRSDGTLFTKDSIDGKSIEDLKQEMKEAMGTVNKIRGFLKAHKNKFSN